MGLDHPSAWLFLVLIGVWSIPRAIAAWRGVIDPRVAQTPRAMRAIIALAYFVTIALAGIGFAGSNVQV
jgi:hypothetical protein